MDDSSSFKEVKYLYTSIQQILSHPIRCQLLDPNLFKEISDTVNALQLSLSDEPSVVAIQKICSAWKNYEFEMKKGTKNEHSWISVTTGGVIASMAGIILNNEWFLASGLALITFAGSSFAIQWFKGDTKEKRRATQILRMTFNETCSFFI